jgi:hypothetical protein
MPTELIPWKLRHTIPPLPSKLKEPPCVGSVWICCAGGGAGAGAGAGAAWGPAGPEAAVAPPVGAPAWPALNAAVAFPGVIGVAGVGGSAS